MNYDKLAETAEDVRQNIEVYVRECRADPDLVRNASKARSWYFLQHDDGWDFAPSRFAGYRKMSAKKYLKADYLDGTETERHLQGWSRPVEENSKQHALFYGLLSSFLMSFNLKPNAKVRFNVLTAVDGAHERGNRTDLVELLLSCISRLSVEERIAFDAAMKNEQW